METKYDILIQNKREVQFKFSINRKNNTISDGK